MCAPTATPPPDRCWTGRCRDWQISLPVQSSAEASAEDGDEKCGGKEFEDSYVRVYIVIPLTMLAGPSHGQINDAGIFPTPAGHAYVQVRASTYG